MYQPRGKPGGEQGALKGDAAGGGTAADPVRAAAAPAGGRAAAKSVVRVGGELSGPVGGETDGEISGEIGGEISGEIGGEIGGEIDGEIGGEIDGAVGCAVGDYWPVRARVMSMMRRAPRWLSERNCPMVASSACWSAALRSVPRTPGVPAPGRFSSMRTSPR